LWSILEQHFTYRLVVELDQIRSLDDAALDQLLLLHDRVAERGGMLRICGLSPRSHQHLLDRQLEDRLVPYQDREEAMMASAMPRRPR
jgi:anti-anti-sigma regulatory factor